MRYPIKVKLVILFLKITLHVSKAHGPLRTFTRYKEIPTGHD